MILELAIVEKWEIVTIRKFYQKKAIFFKLINNLISDVVFLVVFLLFWYFNYSVVLSITGNLTAGFKMPISEVLHQGQIISS